ncbi:Protein of unknown function [Nocardioides szechwanensis]|uniref:DUF4012 domain-containing protein n=1 Tax=Nocardioides szechwanensis TaxID=1005944 RepID=A0A1H0BR78_9ACTN|nr:Protein of unknown function [Nocardioides szechwanensis]
MVLASAFVCYQAWQVQRDLTKAEASVDDLTAAIDSGDAAARKQAIMDLQDAAQSAEERTDGPLWGALTKLPAFGDDAEAVRALSASLSMVATDGVGPLSDSITDLDRVSVGGRIDIDLIEDLQDPVSQARSAFEAAAAEVDNIDCSGCVGALQPRFDEYVERVDEAASALASTETATRALPDMLGASGPRDYLLIFQNNAEIRATGGMPGSWAQLHAEDGELEMVKQGTAGDFPMTAQPVLPLTDEEVAVYGKEISTYFQDPGFTPDFPRAGALWRAHWERKFPDTPIDGVIALDPVAMSYLIDGTGPVSVGGTTLTRQNLVEELLNRPYLELDTSAQDELFKEAAREIFDAITGDLQSPVDLVRGLSKAAEESRLLVAPFAEQDAAALADSNVLGAMGGDSETTPYVDIGLNDATGSKMSYYLRYWADVRAVSCTGGTQELEASMSLSQAIAPAEAAKLPPSVTGGGNYGTEPGSQLVIVRLYGPAGGKIQDIKIDGKEMKPSRDLQLDGRPVVFLAMILETRNDVVVTWSMTAGIGQTGDGTVDVTPGVQPGNKSSSFASAC